MIAQQMAQPMFGPTQQVTKPVPIPAPSLGINAVDGLAMMDPQEAIFMYNMVPASYGVRVRTGYAEYATTVDANGVRTIMPYDGSITSRNRLFAMGQAGIYDITVGGAGPWVASIAFAAATSVSGYGQWTNFTTIAGHFGLYCDEENGYYVYDEVAATWAKITLGGGPTQISGVDPVEFVSVVIFKSRAWFVRKNTAKAYYLAVGSVFGAATEFNFGNKFKHGGTLVNLFTWTVDGGEGVDDYLVAVSSTGDVVVYKGNDPSSATDWFQHGSWYIGPPPAGRRIGGSFGGEVYLLSQYGVLPMSRLISGTLTQQQDIYLSRKITPLISDQMSFSRTSLGWEIKLIPGEQQLIISCPKRVGFDFQQFVQSTNNQAWCIFREIPYFTGDVYLGTFYIGASNGTVYTYQDDTDNVSLDGLTFQAIEWSVLQTFQDYGDPGQFHRAQFIRPVFIATQTPEFSVEARYDYNLSEVFGATSPSMTSGALWDFAVWDSSLWGGEFVVVDNPVGGSGLGRAIAVGMGGQSQARTTLVRYDLMMDAGGLL